MQADKESWRITVVPSTATSSHGTENTGMLQVSPASLTTKDDQENTLEKQIP